MSGRYFFIDHLLKRMKMSDKFSPYAVRRAWLATLLFTLWAGIIVFHFHVYPYSTAVWTFYVLLIFNTFFSVRLFATITPREHSGQKMWDTLLTLCLLALPLTFAMPLNFVFLTLVLFVAATLKYIFLIPIIDFSKLLFRKIRIDTLGILICVMCIAGIFRGYTNVSLNLWTLVFFFSNLYVLWHDPLYRLEHQETDVIS